jgi:hypothetical protein
MRRQTADCFVVSVKCISMVVQHSLRTGQVGCDSHLFSLCSAQSSNFGIYVTRHHITPLSVITRYAVCPPECHRNNLQDFFFASIMFYQGHGWYKMMSNCIWVHSVNLTFIKLNPCSDVLDNLKNLSARNNKHQLMHQIIYNLYL